ARVVDQTNRNSRSIQDVCKNAFDFGALRLRQCRRERNDKLRFSPTVLQTVVEIKICRPQYLRQMVADLLGTAARKQANPGLRRVKAIPRCKFFAADDGQR